MIIIGRTTIGRGVPEVTVKTDGLYFNTAAVRVFSLKAGLFLMFINDERDWQFYVIDSQDGFNLVHHSRNQNVGLDIMSRPLRRMVCSSLGVKPGARLKIDKLNNGYGRITIN